MRRFVDTATPLALPDAVQPLPGSDGLAVELTVRAEEWPDSGIESVTAIGDALTPATIACAVYAGRRYAEELEGPPRTGDEMPFRCELPELAPSTPTDPHVRRRVRAPSCGPLRSRPAHTPSLAGVPAGPTAPPERTPVLPDLSTSTHDRAATPTGAEPAGAIESASSLGQFLQAHQPLPLFVLFFGRASSENPSCSTASSTIG